MKDVASLTTAITGKASRSIDFNPSARLSSELVAASVDPAQLASQIPAIHVAFGHLLNVEGNLDTTLMLDLDNKLKQAMNEVTHSITQALTYR